MINLSPNFIYGLYTCRLLGSVLNGTEPLAMPENMDINRLYAFQASQDIAGMASVALEKLNLGNEKLSQFSADYKLSKLRNARFEIAGDQVFEALEKAEIPFIPLKGALLKNLYPNSAMRSFTDYDIYIGDKIKETEQVMLSLGYEHDHDTENDMDFIKKPSLHFEMHHSLFPSKYDFGGYFNNPFERAEVKEGWQYYHLYRNEDFFIHVLAHIYKHFINCGCGLRQFMDIYVLMKNQHLDMEYINGELDKIGLRKFLATSIKLNNFLFNGEKPTDDILEIAEYVFNSGTFGNVKNSMALEYAQNVGEQGQSFGRRKIKYFANRWQLPYSKMKRQYPVLKYVPILLPFCYIHKLFRVLFFRRDVLKTQITDIENSTDEYTKHINHILKISGAKIDRENNG